MSSLAYLAARLLLPRVVALADRMSEHERRYLARMLSAPLAGREEKAAYQLVRQAYLAARNAAQTARTTKGR